MSSPSRGPQRQLLLLLLSASLACAGRSDPWDMTQLTKTPVFEWDNSTDTTNGIRGVYITVTPKSPLKVFRVYAWYCVPKNRTAKLPAMVVVHGSGGAIDNPYLGSIWSQNGIIGLAVDLFGQSPTGVARTDRISWPMEGNIGFCSMTPDSSSWYIQNAAAITAVSFLCAQPEVDTSRIGAAGGSFGGTRTIYLAGADARIKLAIPLITSAYFKETLWATNNCSQAWDDTWDPRHYISRATCPFFWATGTNDPYFYLDAFYKSTILVKGQCILRMDNIDHNSENIMAQPETFAFAKHVFTGGAPVVRIMNQGHDATTAWATYDSQTVKSATLRYTTDGNSVPYATKLWKTMMAQVNATGKRISASLPSGTTVCFFNTVDGNNQRISSQLIDISTNLPPIPTSTSINHGQPERNVTRTASPTTSARVVFGAGRRAGLGLSVVDRDGKTFSVRGEMRSVESSERPGDRLCP